MEALGVTANELDIRPAATQMLRQGASLPAIGAVLRHASVETTAHYAKVDMALLQEVVRAWPEAQPCS